MFEEIKDYLVVLEDTKLKAEKAINPNLTGSLRAVVSNGYNRYYLNSEKSRATGEYLGKDKMNIARALALNDYNKEITKAAGEEIKIIEKFLRKADPDCIANVWKELSPQRKALITEPYDVDNEEYARKWGESKFNTNPVPVDTQDYQTKRNEFVRSKSELMIANELIYNNVLYKYECEFYLGGGYSFYPDFTILNKRTKKVFIWEHFGLMDDREYRDKAFQKIEIYTKHGFCLWDNLLVTFEDGRHHLNMEYIGRIISENLV